MDRQEKQHTVIAIYWCIVLVHERFVHSAATIKSPTQHNTIPDKTIMMIIHHEHVEVGVFVYQVVRCDRVRVLSYPELNDADKHSNKKKGSRGDFEENELLSIDMIQPASHATFLRLSDQSGWVVADECGEVYMRQLFVETGLFSFYVDNVPSGMLVRRHPMDDSSDLLAIEAGERTYRLEPMQRIYCDAVVQHPQTGVKFFRLQYGGKGAPATPGWVCDRQPAPEKGGLDKYFLLEASKVQTGLFAYKAICGAFIRHRPICSDSSKTSSAVLPNDIVVVDVIRESPYDNGNGPFLRLADGSGWLFEKKLGEVAMHSIPIQVGYWVFAVLNDPVGMVLRKQPMDCQDKVFVDAVYKTGEFVECDRKITNGAGVSFYRVLGTAGWLFDKRNGVPMLSLLSEDTNVEDIDHDIVKFTTWTPDFVRGIAATVDGVQELYYQKPGEILTYENTDGIVVKIFCTTRTMCSIFQHSSKGTIKYFQRDCTPQDILVTLKMDLIETIITYDKFNGERIASANDGEAEEKKADDKTASRSALVKEEETLRLRLLVCESEINAAQARRRDLLSLIKPFDDRRAKVAAWMKESTERYRKANELVTVSEERDKSHSGRSADRKQPPKVDQVSSHFSSTMGSNETDESTDDDDTRLSKSIAKLASMSSNDCDTKDTRSGKNTQKTFACGECYRSFTGKYSRDIHCREVHKIYCEKCEKIYPSFRELEMHRDESNHW